MLLHMIILYSYTYSFIYLYNPYIYLLYTYENILVRILRFISYICVIC